MIVQPILMHAVVRCRLLYSLWRLFVTAMWTVTTVVDIEAIMRYMVPLAFLRDWSLTYFCERELHAMFVGVCYVNISDGLYIQLVHFLVFHFTFVFQFVCVSMLFMRPVLYCNPFQIETCTLTRVIPISIPTRSHRFYSYPHLSTSSFTSILINAQLCVIPTCPHRITHLLKKISKLHAPRFLHLKEVNCGFICYCRCMIKVKYTCIPIGISYIFPSLQEYSWSPTYLFSSSWHNVSFHRKINIADDSLILSIPAAYQMKPESGMQ